MKIALTGGIACGKSLFAKFLRELGIHVLDADSDLLVCVCSNLKVLVGEVSIQ